MPEQLSVLLPVWAGDRPDFLAAAFRSTVRRPDAPARPGRHRAGRAGRRPSSPRGSPSWRRPARFRSTSWSCQRNIGLGPALDAGLAACRHAVVARMDADDISLPHRFAVQLPIIESGVDIVGSGLLEFGDDPGEVVGTRTPPIDPADIRAAGPLRRPVQPPDRASTAATSCWPGRRLHRLRADGGLPALGEDDHGRRAGGQRGRAAGQVPGRAPGPTPAAAGWPSCAPSWRVQRRFRRARVHHPQRSTCATSLVRGGYRLVPERLRRVGVSTRDRDLRERDERAPGSGTHPGNLWSGSGPHDSGVR